ncbi:MAG: hypothetical protein AB7D07_11950 [Desulfovibrionaceae bacterium]
MKQSPYRIGLALFVCLLMFGCALKRPQPNAEVRFDVPSKLSIIKKGADVRLLASKDSNRQTPGFSKELADQLNEAGYFKVDHSPNPQYVMAVNTYWASRCDDSRQSSYNLKYVKKSVIHDNGSGYEFVDKESAASFTCALTGTVSIYEVADMRPLVYFNVAAVDTQWARRHGTKAPKAPCDPKGARQKLMSQIVANIRNLLAREQRKIGVIIPSGGDAEVKRLIFAGKHKQAAKRLKTLLPPASLAELTPELYEKWNQQAEAEERPGRDMGEDLANFYLLLMTQEARGVSAESIREIHDGYAQLVMLGSATDLINASADSLSRVEESAKRLGVPL